MSVSLAIQKALRQRLVGSAGVVALVPAAAILDRNARPAPDPSIVLGEDQAVDEGRVARDVMRIYSILHIWKREAGLTGVKAIADAIRDAVHSAALALEAPYQAGDAYVSSARFLRDPDGETAHGIVTVEIVAGGA